MAVAVTTHPTRPVMRSVVTSMVTWFGGERDTPRRKYAPIALICVFGILARLVFYLAFKPIWSGDSPSYVIPYYLWRNHRFYTGARTPVYPLFLGLAQWLARVPASPLLAPSAGYVAIFLQSALDIAAACVVYFTLRRLKVRGSIALFAALFAATIPELCLLEVNILNMSLSFVFLAACTALFAVLMKRLSDGGRFVGLSLACGVVFACAGLLRSENLVFCTILVAVLLGSWAASKIRRAGCFGGNRAPVAILLMFLSASPLIFAWMTWNYVGIGEFRITTLTGWNRSKTVYNMFDRVGPEDRVLGEALTASYLRRNRDGRIVRDHVWQASDDYLPELYASMPINDPTQPPSALHRRLARVFADVLGMKVWEPCPPGEECTSFLIRKKINTGDYVGAVSSKLIRRYPGAYLKNVAANFFEDTFNYRYLDTNPATEGYQAAAVGGGEIFRHKSLEKLAFAAIDAEAPLLTLLYLVTLGYGIASLWIFFRTAEQRPVEDAIVTGCALATVGTFVAICCLAGYNREYSVPHLGVMAICAAYAVENWPRIRAAVGLRSSPAATEVGQPVPDEKPE